MSDLTETTVSNICAADVGSRVVVTREGVAFDGTLTDLVVTRTEYKFMDRPKVTVHLTVKALEIATEDGFGSKDKVLAELRLTSLPLDYRIQVERESDV